VRKFFVDLRTWITQQKIGNKVVCVCHVVIWMTKFFCRNKNENTFELNETHPFPCVDVEMFRQRGSLPDSRG